MTKRDAYKIVYDDLCKCNMFTGIYDAKNGNEHYMFGIGTVMEAIATGVDEETWEDFLDIFYHNMGESEKKVRK